MLVVERAQADDVERVHKIAADSLSERFAPDWLEGQPASAAERVLVARESRTRTIVGFAMARREAPCTGHLLALAVDHGHRGEGVGSALLREMQHEMALAGAREMYLEVRADDPLARGFYLRHGFRSRGIAVHAYGDGADAVRFVRPL